MNLCKQFANVIDVHSVYEGGVKINHLLSHGIFRKENIFWTTKIVILIAQRTLRFILPNFMVSSLHNSVIKSNLNFSSPWYHDSISPNKYVVKFLWVINLKYLCNK